MEGGGQQIGVVDVSLLPGGHGVEWRNPETAPALTVENRREDGGRVEAWVAKPVDGAAGRDQGGGFTITDQSVRIHCFSQIRTSQTLCTCENDESTRRNAKLLKKPARGRAPLRRRIESRCRSTSS